MVRGFWPRFLGLMFRPRPPDHLLFFPGTRAIHTCFMRFAIDAVALDSAGRVLAVQESVPPWRVVLFPRGTCGVLEMAAGAWAARSNRVNPELEGQNA